MELGPCAPDCANSSEARRCSRVRRAAALGRLAPTPARARRLGAFRSRALDARHKSLHSDIKSPLLLGYASLRAEANRFDVEASVQVEQCPGQSSADRECREHVEFYRQLAESKRTAGWTRLVLTACVVITSVALFRVQRRFRGADARGSEEPGAERSQPSESAGDAVKFGFGALTGVFLLAVVFAALLYWFLASWRARV